MTSDAENPATIAAMVERSVLRRRRFRCLLNQLKEEFGGGRGAYRDIADKVGRSQGAVSRWFSKARGVSEATIKLAAEALDIREEFFNNPALGENPDYKKYLGRKGGGASRSTAIVVRDDEPADGYRAELQRVLRALGAPSDESEATLEYAEVFEEPLHKIFAKIYVDGLRRGKQLQRAADDALHSTLDEEARRRGLRLIDEDPDDKSDGDDHP